MKKNNSKVMILKLILFILSSGIWISSHVKADTINEIPKRMNPGTIIEYKEDNKYTIVKEGKPLSEEELSLYAKYEERQLPLGKKGVVVEYGFSGFPVMVKGVTPGEERLRGVHHAHAAAQPDARDGELVEGWFTFYNGHPNERGFSIENYDCATQQTVDNPPYGATIVAKNLKNGKMVFLKKKDVGRLSRGVVLDIRPHVFTKILGAKLEQGVIEGAYYHD